MVESQFDDSSTPAPAKVLIACDHPETRAIWTFALRQRQLDVVAADTVEKAFKLWSQETPDLIIIDAHTDKLDALSLCRKIRTEAVVPILLLVPDHNETRLLEAYATGADDCLVKPVSPALLLAKVKAWLRRTWTVAAESLDHLEVAGLRLDPNRRLVIQEGKTEQRLTNLEFRLLHLLLSHPGWVFTSDEIIQRVWGHYGEGDKTLLKNVVYRLRRKIEPDPTRPHFIHTESGTGYRFDPH